MQGSPVTLLNHTLEREKINKGVKMRKVSERIDIRRKQGAMNREIKLTKESSENAGKSLTGKSRQWDPGKSCLQLSCCAHADRLHPWGPAFSHQLSLFIYKQTEILLTTLIFKPLSTGSGAET